MRSWEEIYNEICDKRGFQFSIRQLIHIFNTEQGNFPGEKQQVLWIKSYVLELTGIRPGECGQCNIAAIKDLSRWVIHRYEKEHGITWPPEIEIADKK